MYHTCKILNKEVKYSATPVIYSIQGEVLFSFVHKKQEEEKKEAEDHETDTNLLENR